MKHSGIWLVLLLSVSAMADTNKFPLAVERIEIMPVVFRPKPPPEFRISVRPPQFTNIENRIGETISGFLVKEVIPKEQSETNRFGKVQRVDRTEIVLERDGTEFRVIRGREQHFTEQKVTLVAATNGHPLTVAVGAPFEFMGRRYRIEKVNEDARTCTVRDLSTDELLTTRPNEAPTPRTLP